MARGGFRFGFPFLSALVLFACATQSEFRLLNQQLAANQSRLQQLEEQERRDIEELRKNLETLRNQLADLLARLQALEVNQQALQGQGFRRESEKSELLTRMGALEAALEELKQRVSALEQSPSSPGASKAKPLGEEELYPQALSLYEQGDYEKAEGLFETLLERFPQGKYRLNAEFWLGEIRFRQKKYPEAIARYLEVIEKDPKHPKAPAAYLKMAMSLKELKETERARRALEDLIRLYPDSPQAAEAKKLLKRW